ncbi:MAG: 4Fe-4S binding protein [Clostridiales Family XIII bacterium]|jgi:Fe-S-cluster-containing dehydrogenase component|nr:4Fe-4S binding protein [Clostridiales Family XIII bacterium]
MKRLKLEKEKCLGCKLCAVVCSAYKEGAYRPSAARLDIQSHYENGGLVYDDRFCILCGICAKNCPEGAIVQEEYITVDHSKCVGCGTCLEKCPKNAPKIRDKKSYICDTCEGTPNCVRTCPQNALVFA